MREDVEALRRRLYRPDATPADLASYLDAAPTTAPDPDEAPDAAPTPDADAASTAADARPVVADAVAPAPPAPRRRRRVRVAAAAAGGLVVLGGLLLVVRETQPAPDPTPTAVAATAAPRDPGDSIIVLPTVADGGAQTHATGEAHAIDTGRYRYRVAAGDTVIGLAARFGLCRSEVIAAIPDGGRWPVVEPGEVLLLQHDRDAILADGGDGC